MNNPIRQHTVPRFYLEAFTDSSGYTHVFDRDRNKEWRAAPKDVSVENHFYSLPEDWKIGRFALEKSFAKIEAATASTLRLLRSERNLRAIDKYGLSYFLATQIKRTTLLGDQHSRLDVAMKDPKLVYDYIEKKRSTLERRFGKEAVDAYAKMVLAGDSLPSISNGEMMLLGQQNIPEYAELIADMHWRLEKRRTPTFVTSDNPVFVRRNGRSHDQGLVGIKRRDLEAELYFPISPTLFLIATWQKARDNSRFASDLRSRELNRLTILCSNRQIYACSLCDADRLLIGECTGFRLSFFDPRQLLE